MQNSLHALKPQKNANFKQYFLFPFTFAQFILLQISSKQNVSNHKKVCFEFENVDYIVFSVCCCVLLDVEIFVKKMFLNKFGEDFNEKVYLRYLKYVICSFYVFILLIVALLGFHFSIQGIKVFFDNVVRLGGYFYFWFGI